MTIGTVQIQYQVKKSRSNLLKLIKQTTFKSIILSTVILASTLMSTTNTIAQPPLQLLVKRFIIIKSLAGTVQYRSENSTSTAQVGQRLTEVGDAIITGKKSSATLARSEERRVGKEC